MGDCRGPARSMLFVGVKLRDVRARRYAKPGRPAKLSRSTFCLHLTPNQAFTFESQHSSSTLSRI